MRIIDLHCDTLYNALTRNITLDDRRNEVLFEPSRADSKLQCYAVWIPDGVDGKAAENMVVSAHKLLCSECDRLGIKLIKHGERIRTAFTKNKNSALFTIENGSALNGRLDNVERFAGLGVKMMTLTWNARNQIGGGAEAQGCGITPFGEAVLSKMEEHGIIVDVSHACERLFYDVAERTKLPFAASHSNAFSVTRHKRNLTDDQIKTIIERKGLIGLNFHNAFLNNDPDNACTADILRHTEHFLSLGADDCLCFGSDFDGGCLPFDIADSRVYENICEMYLKHGYSEALIKRIFYENALNFLEYFDNRQIM